MRAPGVSRRLARTESRTDASSPASSAVRSRSEAAKSSSPRIADSVTLATSSAHPARAASRSMTSSWIRVESTSITMSRIARRCRPPRCTATSTPLSAATCASAVRSGAGSAPDTSSSMQVTGSLASRVIRSMFAPLAAIRPATAAIASGRSGLPSTVTCNRPGPPPGRWTRFRRASGDLRVQPQVRRQAGDGTVDRGQVRRLVARGQHAEHEPAPDDNLLDVQHAQREPCEGAEQARSHPGPVPAGQGDQQRDPWLIHREPTVPSAGRPV